MEHSDLASAVLSRKECRPGHGSPAPSGIGRTGPRTFRVAVQGCGHWVRIGIRPDLLRLKKKWQAQQDGPKIELFVDYVSIEETCPVGTVPLATQAEMDDEPKFDEELNNERYFCSSRSADLRKVERERYDIVIVASADHAHLDGVATWLDRAKGHETLIIVEKPFMPSSWECGVLDKKLRGMSEEPGAIVPDVFSFDHYLLYALPLLLQVEECAKRLGPITEVIFQMTETGPIEHNRLSSLQHGMSFDMFSHGLGLLSLFCEIETIKMLELHSYGKHRFSKFENLHNRVYYAETFGELSFDIRMRSNSTAEEARWVSCYARFGKALAAENKYLELRDDSGRCLRLDLTRQPANCGPDGAPYRYPYRSLFVYDQTRPNGVATASASSLNVSAQSSLDLSSELDQPQIVHNPGPDWTVDYHHPEQMIRILHGFLDGRVVEGVDMTKSRSPIEADAEQSDDAGISTTFSEPTRHGIIVEAVATNNNEILGALMTPHEAAQIVSRLEQLRERLTALPAHHPGWDPWALPIRTSSRGGAPQNV